MHLNAKFITLAAMNTSQPLADRMRPNTLDKYVGQQHLVGELGVLRKGIESGNIPSFIMWGPPGVGKTTLARIIANQLQRPFYILSAINSGVKDIRETIEKAQKHKFFNKPGPVMFIDEIHRFNKSQQDSLLAAVEDGTITLIGATTENPSFEVISPLLSRCQVYILKSFESADLILILKQAIGYDVELKNTEIILQETDALLRFCGGDARKLLNILELVVVSEQDTQGLGKPIIITNELVVNKLQENIALYDKNGEQHYDVISAFIKSMRGSDPNAAVYWLARMLEGGEDPKFIARRMLILAAEDIGLANPNALLIANSCFQAIDVIGMPEARIILSEAVIYLATSAKSNSAYTAINDALSLVKRTGGVSVPLHLRNAPTHLMKDIGYGKDYKYAHDFDGNFIADNFMPESMKGIRLFEPGNNPRETEILKKLQEQWRKLYGY